MKTTSSAGPDTYGSVPCVTNKAEPPAEVSGEPEAAIRLCDRPYSFYDPSYSEIRYCEWPSGHKGNCRGAGELSDDARCEYPAEPEGARNAHRSGYNSAIEMFAENAVSKSNEGAEETLAWEALVADQDFGPQWHERDESRAEPEGARETLRNALENADITLDWLLARFRQSLTNTPIRDADECIVRAERTQKNITAALASQAAATNEGENR